MRDLALGPDSLPQDLDSGSPKDGARPSGIPRIAGSVVTAVGMAVLSGWFVDIEALKVLLPQQVAMNPVTAACLALMGLVLMSLTLAARAGRSVFVWSSRFVGMTVVAIGLGKFAELLFNVSIGFDSFLFTSELAEAPVITNQMAPNTALCLSFLGAALVCLAGASRRLAAAGQICALSAAVIAMVAMARYFPTGLHSSAACLILAAGLLWTQPHLGIMAVVSRRDLQARADLPFSLPMLTGAFITLMVIVCASFWGGEQARSSIDVIEKTRESQLGVERLLTLLEGAEARQRGFLLTGDEKYFTHFEQAAAALEASFGNVTGLAGENPARRRQLDEMGLRIIDVLSQLRATIALSRTGGPEAATAAIGSSGVAMLLNEIRAIVDAMNNEQEAILDRLGERQESILLLVRIAELFGIVILAIAGMTLTQQATQTMNALKSARESDAAATAAATAANRSKSDFLASMSHEIRTPLNGVLGNLELLAQSDLNPAQEDLLFDADKAAKSLLALIGNVLDFSKIEAGKLAIETVDMKPDLVIQEAVDIVQSRARQKGIQVTASIGTGVPESILGDPTRLRQILLNLLGNAVKFTATGGVHVRLSVTGWDGDVCRLLFEVHDSGRGFEASKAEELFEPFTQDKQNATDVSEGTGLGLSICRRLVETFGGAIGSDSVPGGGSTFWFTLPARVVTTEQAEAPLDLGKRRIVFIEPPSSQRPQALHSYFQARGATVLTAETSEDALVIGRKALLKGEHIDIAIHVLQRSAWPAPEVSATLREMGAVPVVAGTLGAATDWRRALQSGASYLLADTTEHPPIDRNIRRILGGTSKASARSPRGSRIELANRAALVGKHLLVIEDRLINQTVIQRQLKALGVSCAVAANGLEALEKVESPERFDAILCDCSMPIMNGYEFTRALRRRELGLADGRHMPVIAMTANAFREDMESCFNAGMDDFISKPVVMARLVAVLLQWLGGDAAPAILARDPDASGPEHPGTASLDLPALFKMMATDDREIVLDHLKDFSSAAWESWQQVAINARDSDAIELGLAAHGAKGEAQSAGANALGELYGHLEVSAKAGDMGNVALILQRIPAELARVADFIDSYKAGVRT